MAQSKKKSSKSTQSTAEPESGLPVKISIVAFPDYKPRKLKPTPPSKPKPKPPKPTPKPTPKPKPKPRKPKTKPTPKPNVPA